MPEPTGNTGERQAWGNGGQVDRGTRSSGQARGWSWRLGSGQWAERRHPGREAAEGEAPGCGVRGARAQKGGTGGAGDDGCGVRLDGRCALAPQ